MTTTAMIVSNNEEEQYTQDDDKSSKFSNAKIQTTDDDDMLHTPTTRTRSSKGNNSRRILRSGNRKRSAENTTSLMVVSPEEVNDNNTNDDEDDDDDELKYIQDKKHVSNSVKAMVVSPVDDNDIITQQVENDVSSKDTNRNFKLASSKSKDTRTTTTTTSVSVRRTLFNTKQSTLVSPRRQQQQKNKKDSSDSSIVVVDPTQPPPPAKRRLIFGRFVDEIHCNRNVKMTYSIVKKLTGAVGGNGYSGPIYGELTMGSMQKMINLMISKTNLNSKSRFIDVGSGIGKPNLHVAQYPGVEFSCGVEMEQVRWTLGMSCLKAVLDVATKQQQNDYHNHTTTTLPSQDIINGRCIFLHRNITEARTFDPFTHVYMFSIGFPPSLWVKLAKMWNRSNSDYLICYHPPKKIIELYEFDVELITQTQTSMHGSKEGHMGYIYSRCCNTNNKHNNNNNKKLSRGKINFDDDDDDDDDNFSFCDKLFIDAWNLVKSGLGPLHREVTSQIDEAMGGIKTRSRKRIKLTRY